MADLIVHYVVIGGGIAGVSCAETLCSILSEQENESVNVLLVSESTLVRVAANVEQLTQTLAQFDVEESTASDLQNRLPGLRVLTGEMICSLDPKEKLIKLSSGRSIKYTKSVCVCTGARPRKLPGMEDNERVLTLRDTESVHMLEEKLKGSKRVVVVGNGGIATELVYELVGVQEVIWVVRDKHVSAAFIDPGAAQFFLSSGALTKTKAEPEQVIKRLKYAEATEEHLNSGAALGPDWHSRFAIQGPAGKTRPSIRVEYECTVHNVWKNNENNFPQEQSGWPLAIKLSNFVILGCDLLVVATGVIPNCEIFEGVLDLAPEGGGIKVDKLMKTSAPGVFAAGDVMMANWPRDEHWYQMRLWTQARQTGCYAARCMISLADAPMYDFCFQMFAHVTRFFGYKVVLLGLHNGQTLAPGWEALVRITPNKEYIKLVLANGRVHGAVLVGDTELEETCENLILNQIDVSALGDDLLNPDVDIEDYFD